MRLTLTRLPWRLWKTAGVILLSEERVGQERPVQDRHLYRVDLASPHPEKVLERVEVHSAITGVTLLIAGASSMEHP